MKRIDNIEISDDQKDIGVLRMEIDYPRSEDSSIDTFQIGMCDTRATDDIRVSYDFERDGWVIYQSKEHFIDTGDNSVRVEEEWIESAFCPAWKFTDWENLV